MFLSGVDVNINTKMSKSSIKSQFSTKQLEKGNLYNLDYDKQIIMFPKTTYKKPKFNF
jgi:hypothetical protein